jgi:hypothetical protein
MATTPDDAAKGGPKKVRVLRAHEKHRPNHVITLDAKAAAAAVKDGWADDDADAVAYAEKNEPQPKAEG